MCGKINAIVDIFDDNPGDKVNGGEPQFSNKSFIFCTNTSI